MIYINSLPLLLVELISCFSTPWHTFFHNTFTTQQFLLVSEVLSTLKSIINVWPETAHVLSNAHLCLRLGRRRWPVSTGND